MGNHVDQGLYIWREAGREGHGEGVGPVLDVAGDGQEVAIPFGTQGPAQGTYRRLHPREEQVVTAQNNQGLPVFLHADWTAYTESWAHKPGQPVSDLGAAIEKVRRRLEEQADRAVERGHESISPVLTTSDSEGSGATTVVEGHVVLIRPAVGS